MTSVPSFTDADLLNAMLQLLPKGRAWPTTNQNSNMYQTLAALVPTLTTLCNYSAGLITDAFPATTIQLVPEWQASLGLPDPCSGSTSILQQEQAQIVARFAGIGGQSVRYLIGYAVALGYTITITEFWPFCAGLNTAGQPVSGEAWAFALQINAPLETITYFRADESSAGEPLASWGNQVLECELERISPAQAVLIFSYT